MTFPEGVRRGFSETLSDSRILISCASGRRQQAGTNLSTISRGESLGSRPRLADLAKSLLSEHRGRPIPRFPGYGSPHLESEILGNSDESRLCKVLVVSFRL